MALYHSARGSVGYTIVGSPTIIDGVMSGIDDSNYAELSADATDTDIHDYEFGTEVVIPAEPDNIRGHILAYRAGSLEGIAYRSDTNAIRWYIARKDGTVTDIYIDSSLTLSPGDTAIIQCSYLGNNVFQLAVSKDNGINWTKDTVTQGDYNFYAITTAQRFRFGRAMGTTSNYYFSGSINLKKTYIKVGGQAWFGICPIEVKSHQLRGPVGYEISGDGPTVTDGILTGLTSSSTCRTTQSLPDFNTFEFMTKVQYPNASSAAYIPVAGFGTGSAPTNRFVANSNRNAIYNGSTQIVEIPNSDFDFVSAASAGYYIKGICVKNENDYSYTISVSLDKTNWVTASADYASNIFANYACFLRTSTGYAGGIPKMDLNETYIKVNGKLWFWQPRETEKIVVNGVEVWTKPSPTPTPTPTPTPAPVIDANTVALFHGDTDTSNAIQGSDTALESSFSVYSTDKKFGAGSLLFTFPSRAGKYMLSGTAPIPSSGSFTWDMWVNASLYAGSSDYQGAIGGIYGFPTDCSVFVFRGVTSDSSKVQVYGWCNSTYSSVINLDATDWHHIAFEYDSTAEVSRWYVNGNLLFTVSGALSAGVRNLRSNPNGNYARQNLYIDELRISNVARYGGNNFTPNTLPYGG